MKLFKVSKGMIFEMPAGVYISTLWVFTMFSILFRDIHEFAKASYINEVLTGTINGTQINDQILFVGFFIVEIPILMIVLSRILKPRLNQVLNVVAAIATSLVLVGAGLGDLDDKAFLAVELAALTLIIATCLSWRSDK